MMDHSINITIGAIDVAAPQVCASVEVAEQVLAVAADRDVNVVVESAEQNLAVGDADVQVEVEFGGPPGVGAQEVFEEAVPPVVNYPAINFIPVPGWPNLCRQQINVLEA